jgi:hypothetical protein
MPALRVLPAQRDDIYRDIVRCAEEFRRDDKGRLISEGTVCSITIGNRTTLGLIRGVRGIESVQMQPCIYLDERLRASLGVELGAEVSVSFRTTRFGEFWWAWNSSDPAYRAMARLAVLSVALGLLGLLAGIVGLVIATR